MKKKIGCLGLIVILIIAGLIGAGCDALFSIGDPEMPNLKGKDVNEAADQLKELEISNIAYQDTNGGDWELKDIEGWVVAEQYPNKGIKVDEDDEIILTCTSKEAYDAQNKHDEEKDALDKKLDLTTAWTAAHVYGEDEFPYGFDLHSAMGVIAEDPIDSDTWFLKASADITNEYGAEAEYICEIKVSGTTDNPEVVDFKAYEK